ncbi:MAG: zinc ribbon domain-containing protein [Candidatus Omnitrophica bacterium]|nr:zinc ribbon domain-containing protein [Candidatus Omnitrophota bacterium]
MPTYEYKCLKCKKVFDQLQPITAKPLKTCIHCKGKVERLIGAGSGLIFKGSGFYATDYKKQGVATDKAPSSKEPKKESPPKK